MGNCTQAMYEKQQNKSEQQMLRDKYKKIYAAEMSRATGHKIDHGVVTVCPIYSMETGEVVSYFKKID